MKTQPDDVQVPEEEPGVIREIWMFLRVRKKFWLAPIIIVLVILGLLIFLAGSAGTLSPFIYAF